MISNVLNLAIESSSWSRITSTSNARRHSTKPFRLPRPDAWSSASNGITRQSTAGSQCLDRRIPDKQTLIDEIAARSRSEMPITPRPTGTSQHRRLASNSGTRTLRSD